MIIHRMHQEFKYRYNSLDTNHNRDMLAAHIDDALNDAHGIFLESVAYGGNSQKPYKFGFESTQQRKDMLATLLVGTLDQPALEPYTVVPSRDISAFNLDELEYPYAHLVNAFFIDSCDKRIEVTIKRHNTRNDKFSKPSKLWKRAIGLIKSGVLGTGDTIPKRILEILYPEEVNALFVEYLKQPKKVFIGGYNTLEFENGVAGAYQATDPPVSSDLPEIYHSMIVDIAVMEASRNIGDFNKSQTIQEKILINN